LEARKKTRREPMAANSTRPGEFLGATIVRLEGEHIVLKTADGTLARIGSGIGEDFDVDGRKLTRRENARILKAGNVVDVKTRQSTRTGQMFLASIRLVRGELLPAPTATASAARARPDMSNQPATYRGARIVKVSNYQRLVDVGGQQILLGSVTRATKAFDMQGKPIADGHATRLIWEANVVDVVTDPPTRGTAYTRGSAKSGSSRARSASKTRQPGSSQGKLSCHVRGVFPPHLKRRTAPAAPAGRSNLPRVLERGASEAYPLNQAGRDARASRFPHHPNNDDGRGQGPSLLGDQRLFSPTIPYP
jgi:hypothetical protein